jgi:hypothetical protein
MIPAFDFISSKYKPFAMPKISMVSSDEAIFF